MTDIAVTEYFPPHPVGAVESTEAWEEHLRKFGIVEPHPKNKRPVRKIDAGKTFSGKGLLSLGDAGSFLSSAFTDDKDDRHDLSLFAKIWTPVIAEGQKVLDSSSRIITGFRFNADMTELLPGESQVADAYHIDDSAPRYEDADNRILKRISDRFDLRGLWVNGHPGKFIVPPEDQEMAIIERHGYVYKQPHWQDDVYFGDKEFIKFNQESLIAEAGKNGWFEQFPAKTTTAFVSACAIHIGGTPEVTEVSLHIPFNRLLVNIIFRTEAKYNPPSRRIAMLRVSLAEYSRK